MEQTNTPVTLISDATIYPTLVAHSLDEADEYRAICERTHKMEQDLKNSLHPDIWKAVTALIEERGQQADAFARIIFSELQRHLPGLAPGLRIVADHVLEVGPHDIGRCCVEAPQGTIPSTSAGA
jgi:hypothetical protein